MSAKYAQAVYGNLAYGASDAAAADRELEVPVRPGEREDRRIYEEQKVKVQTRTKTASRQGVSPFAVAGCVCVAALFFLMLLSYISLAEISKESVDLQNQLSLLNTEETRLKLNYESAFDLNEVERYATNELGMTKAGENQVLYIRSNTADQAMILQPKTADKGAINLLSKLLSRLADIFA